MRNATTRNAMDMKLAPSASVSENSKNRPNASRTPPAISWNSLNPGLPKPGSTLLRTALTFSGRGAALGSSWCSSLYSSGSGASMGSGSGLMAFSSCRRDGIGVGGAWSVWDGWSSSRDCTLFFDCSVTVSAAFAETSWTMTFFFFSAKRGVPPFRISYT